MPNIGETTALIPQAGSSTKPEHLQDGGSGDIDFPFGTFKALATVGEIDPENGHVLTGYPDGHAAWLVDQDTVRVVYQSESYATLSASEGETYGWEMDSGAVFTGSHVHIIDYDRQGFADFLNNDEPASDIFQGAGHLFNTVYNVFGEIVDGKNLDPNDLSAKWGNQTLADGTVVEFDADQLLTQGDWFFHSFCGAYYEQAHKYGDGIGFEDDMYLMGEEWNIGELFEEAAAEAGFTEENSRLSPGEDFFTTTMGLASMVVDIENETAYTVPVLGQSGYEKILPMNSGHEDYVVLVMAGYNLEVEPAPLMVYVGKKGVDEDGNALSEDASERDSFLGRNGLLYGQLYGMALDDDTYAELGIETVDADTFMMDAYAKDADAPNTFSARYIPTSYQWDGFDTPEAAADTEVFLWEKDGDTLEDGTVEANEQPDGYTYFNGDSKTEHPAVDPDITKHRYVQNLTVPSAQLGIEFIDIVNELENNDADGNGLPDYLSADVTRILAGVDGSLTLETGGKGLGHQSDDLNPDGTLTHAIHIEDGEARMDQPDGLQWVKAADGDFLIVDEDSGNDAGERKYVLPIDGETLQLEEPGKGYFLASAGGSDNPRALEEVAAIPGTFTRATSSEFSGTWNVTHLVETKEDGSFYTQEEIAGTGAQEIIGSVPLAEQTFIGVVQHRGESSGIIAERQADQGGQIFQFNINLDQQSNANSVIFIHPDGTTPSHFAAGRFASVGPDGRLNWDKMTNAGVYLGHMDDTIVGTSNGGAVVHAYGIKSFSGSYGLDEEGNPYTSLSGQEGMTIMEEAIAAGKATAVINSGFIAEPGTGVFLADVESRRDVQEITLEIVESGVDVIMGGGEIHYLPIGTVGRFGQEGIREDGRNLIEEAQAMGYTVVYTREDLESLSGDSEKVLGIFAAEDTYNDVPEGKLIEDGFVDENGELILYGQPGNENPPTVAEMLETTLALDIFQNPENGMFVVLEEEATDNFGNNNNGVGTVEAVLRADAAIGVAQDYIDNINPNTLLVTAADSDGGGLEVDDVSGETTGTTRIQTPFDTRIPLDGTTGEDTEPFVTGAPDANGDTFEFGVLWSGVPDVAGSIVSKTYGLNAEKLPATVDNTGIYRLMYETLFDEALAPPDGVPDNITPPPEPTKETGNVIFIHPDGTSPSHYAAARFASEGPDGRLNWDNMTDAGVYLGHIDDRLVSTSNAGAVVHAFGVKPFAGSYGLDEDGNPITSLSGQQGQTILEEAIAAGKPSAVINSGFIAEPGTGVFLAEAENRRDVTGITEDIVESGVDVIMGGGEIHYLPVGTVGFFGQEGIREDGRNLIEEAQAMGYTVLYTREDLENLSADTEKVLGIFAAEDTYNDTNEAALIEQGLVDENGALILYGQPGNENPPTVAEMLQATLALDKFTNAEDGFMVVLEEEGSDNFPNNNNGAGAIEATLRADAAIGVAQDFVNNVNPNTLILTAADSDAGGLEVDDVSGDTVGTVGIQPTLAAFGEDVDGIPVPLDGTTGNDTAPFVTGKPDADGDIFEFGVGYVSTSDVAGSIVSKAYGLNSDLLTATVDNTDMYRIMYQTLFGVAPEAPKLVGFSSLPADTFEPGLPGGSGNSIDSDNRDTPFDEQPVQGFSGVQFAEDGNYWFLSDNGYGNKANSDDYLLRIFKVDPNFQTSDGGTGEAEVLDFIQLSDPNDFIPFDIVQEGTAERLLTGADFDVESIVVTEDRIWIGEEFGPYLLEFSLDGELLSAPIATPNFVEFDSLNGQTPLVIGHRGASGERPEHTLEAYELAIEQGADFIEPDLVATKDGVLIARHENALAEVQLDENGQIVFDTDGNPIVTSETTNVATFEKFSDRLTVKSIDGELIGGWFSEDFTLAEIKELRAREGIPATRPDNTQFNDQFEIPTLAEVIQLVKDVEAETGKQIGIYPETKHPTYFEEEGTLIDGTPIDINLGAILVSTLVAEGFTDPDRIFIQSFEVANLIELENEILPFFSNFFGSEMVDIPLVQLLGDTDDAFINDAGGGFSVPYDIVYNFSQEDFDATAASETYGELVNLVPDFGQDVTGDDIPDTTYQDLATAEIFNYIGQAYAEGVGPWKNSFLLRESLDEPVDGNGDGVAEITSQLTGDVRPYIEWAHNAGMQIHPYTLRNEERFLTLNPDGTPQTPEQEIEQLINLGVDGFFTDFPETGAVVRDQLAATEVRSPDNPAVLDGDAEGNLSRSRGYEGLGYTPDRMTLYPLLEGSVAGDPDNALRIYEFDVASASFADELAGYYELDDPSHAIGDMTPINDNEFIVIERDGGQGETALFKKLFKVDLSQIDENGFVEKTELVDLLNIADPDDLNNDGSLSFEFPFVTIEDVLVLDETTLLVANDNNYPFSIGRGPDIDNNEIIQIELNEPLNLDSRLGIRPEVGLSVDQTTVSEDTDTYTLTFTLDKAAPTGGLRVVWSEVDSDNELGDIEFPPTLTNAANLEQLTPEGDELARSAITIDEGATSATVTFTTVADMVTEGEETNTYTLIDEVGYGLADASSVSVTIEDTSVEPPVVSRMVMGTPGDDVFDTEDPGDTGFIGDNQILFAGSGDDYVDVTSSSGGPRSRLDLGSGDDILFAGSDNRILAGVGDDILFIGYAEGNNTVTGGSGMDQFWIVTDQEVLPTNANTITDFTIGEDVIGFGFGITGLSFENLMLTQNGVDTTINALGKDLAILRSIQSSDLSASDFVFA
ncbi:MAG: alkaline phosphatase [Crocosphaera sp.]|nr:alkaline phosphatase [Crocosphaera sp.]